MADYKELYNDIKKIIQKFNKNLYFDTIDNKMLFINTFDNDNFAYISRFNDKFYGRYKSFEIYYNQDGYNYLADSLSTPVEYERFFELDGFIIMQLPSDALTMEEGKFIHSLNYKIKKEDNILIYKYTCGKGRKLPTIKELEVIYNNLDFLDSLIKEDYVSIMSAQEVGRIAASHIDTKELNYSVSYIERANINYNVKFHKANKAFVEEFKDKTYYKEAFLFTSYYPMVIKETGVRPLMITYLVPSQKINVRYIMSARSTYKDVIYGILDDILETVGFLPEKLSLDSRDLLGILKNTLDELHIEYELVVNSMDPIQDKLLLESDLSKKPGLFDDPTDIQPKEAVETFLNYLVSNLRNLDYSNMDFEELEDEDEEEIKPNSDVDTDLIA